MPCTCHNTCVAVRRQLSGVIFLLSHGSWTEGTGCQAWHPFLLIHQPSAYLYEIENSNAARLKSVCGAGEAAAWVRAHTACVDILGSYITLGSNLSVTPAPRYLMHSSGL